MRLIGLEPTQPELPDPKSGASTNFATGARFAGAKVVISLELLSLKHEVFFEWA